MPSLDLTALSSLADDLTRLSRDIPDLKREFYGELAEMGKQTVDAAIDGSINDAHGTIKAWQHESVGSGGGYARVAPSSSLGSGKNASPGAITNYLESGHKIRRPKGSARYRPRIRMAYVKGRGFYGVAKGRAEAQAIQMSADFVDKLAKRLEGRGK